MYTRQRLVDHSDFSIKQINDNFSALFLKLSGNIDTIDMKDGAITGKKIAMESISIGHLDSDFISNFPLLDNTTFISYSEGVNDEFAQQATLIQQNSEQISLHATKIDGLGQDIASLVVRADEISSTVSDNREYVDNQIIEFNGQISTINTTISNQYSSITQRADSIETNVSNLATTVTTKYSDLDGKITSLTNTVTQNHSSITQRADSIETSVTNVSNSVTENYNTLNGKITSVSKTVTNNHSSITQRADSIEADVVNVSNAVTQNYNTLNGKISSLTTTVSDNHSNITQRADSIETSVTNVSNSVTENYNTLDGKITSVSETVTNNHSSITQRANSIETSVTNLTSTTNSLGNTVSSHSSSISQLADNISSKVNYTDYNGREIVSLIEQTASSIKISANKIDLSGITTIHSSERPNEDYFKFSGSSLVLYENNINRMDMWYDGANVSIDGSPINFRSSIYFNNYIDFSNANVSGLNVVAKFA